MSVLVISRRQGEAVRIGSEVCVRLVSISGSQVRIAVEAPPEIAILREELWERAAHANREAAAASPEDLRALVGSGEVTS